MSPLNFPRLRSETVAIALGSFSALALSAAPASADQGRGFDRDRGQVFTETNGALGNSVLAFDRAADGSLIQTATVATGGAGTGGGLGSQGPVAVADGVVYAVNAGSGDVTVLRGGGRGGLRVVDREAAGVTPVSITVRGSLAFVLDAAGTGQVLGYRVAPDGDLWPIPGSSRPLSPTASGAAEVSLSPDGRRLVVTEKGTNAIDTYRVGFGGRLDGPVVNTSSGAVPFGFAFDPFGRLIVSEAGSGTASSYNLGFNGVLTPISASVPALQGAPCWVAITPNGRYAYTGNGGTSNSITGFAISSTGALTKLRADGISGVSPRANEVSISPDGRSLYNVSPPTGSITAFAIGRDGALTALPTTAGLPIGIVGLASN